MSKGKVAVLGINGHIGHHAALAFQQAGWDVTGFGRSNRQPVAGIQFIQGDAADLDQLKAVIKDADIVVNGLNLPYDKWDKSRAEAQLATVIAAMGESGKTMMFPGNIYNYAASDRRMAPATPQRPQTPRGEIRVRLEQMLEAASKAGKFQTIIVRAGDFYGPDNTGDYFDQAMLMNARKGELHHMGDPSIGHAWAYLPDLGVAFTRIAAQRNTLGAFERFHFAGNYVTHAEMVRAIEAAAPVQLTPRQFPWWLLRIMGLAMPMMREVAKMGYLSTNPMELVDPRLDAILGPDFGTPFDIAVVSAVRQFFPKTQAVE